MPEPDNRITSREQAANLALSHLREGEIASYDGDQTQRAREVRKWFPTTRDALLRKKHWNFCKSYAVPARDPVDAGGPLKKRYPLPPDCLMVRSVDGLENDEWEVATAIVEASGVEVEAAVLLTNADAPNVEYTRRVVNVALWDAEFVVAFARALAANMAPAFGKTFAETMQRDAVAKDNLDAAARTDSRERAPTNWPRSNAWTDARTGIRQHPWRR